MSNAQQSRKPKPKTQSIPFPLIIKENLSNQLQWQANYIHVIIQFSQHRAVLRTITQPYQ